MNEHLRRAVQALEAGAADVRNLSLQSTGQVRHRLRATVDQILTHLEADERADQGEPEDIVARLARQSQDIADDLRRAEELMKRRTGRE